MYEQISSNKRRSIALIFFFILLIAGMGYLIAMRTGHTWVLPIAAVVAIVGSIGSYYAGDSIVLAMSQARPVTKDDYPHLVNSVEGLAIAAGLPNPPKIYVIDDTAPNAFATGRDPKHASLAVTTGLLSKMNRVELEGVIAHEMAHIQNYDIRLMALVAILAGTVVLLADWMRYSTYWGHGGRRRDRDGGGIIAILTIVAIILAPIIATLMQLAISRRREFLADAQGALLTRYPDGLASALEKIAADTEPLEVANKATAPMYIYNPLREHGEGKTEFASLFETHPPLEERIKRLREM